MPYTVVFTPEAQAQLIELYSYIADEASPETAARFTDGIVTYCESLSSFPERGTRRDDVRSGLRVTSYRKRVVIAFAIYADQVQIIGIFYGGQNYEAILQDEA